MARGLSELQQFIIIRAAERESVSYSDLLASFFGFEPSKVDKRGFSPVEIGENRYNSAMASLSRACRRLHRRGLIQLDEANEGCRAVVLTALSQMAYKNLSPMMA